MKEALIQNLDNAAALEQLFRKDKNGFKKAFDEAYATNSSNANLQFWHARLNYKEEQLNFGNKREFTFVIILAIVAGMFANISNISNINVELFFTRNTVFLILPFITTYYIYKQNLSLKIKTAVGFILIILATYINLLPNNPNSSSINLVYIHLPLLLWSILGYGYLGNDFYSSQKRINFLKFNGDFLIMTAVIILSCLAFTIITFGLFNLIGIKIEKFYMQYIAIWGIGGIPILATYLIDHNPQIINKVSPLIAKIFTPLVFINLLVYLITLIYTGKYPHNDRNLLLIYNALLVGVLALIFFSIAETETSKRNYFSTLLLFGLSLLTITVNCIALSAIIYRIFEWGITPNRITVLGGNVIIFINLILVSYQLLKALKNKTNLTKVEDTIATYLPIYAIWTGIVALMFPIVFHGK